MEKYQSIEDFADAMGVDFHPAGRGIGHQIMVEEGYAWPGTLVVASDSHSNMYGGMGCLGTPVVRTDAAALWATSQTWWQIPPITRVELTGKLKAGVTGKDIIITLCGLYNQDEVLNHVLEFVGNGIKFLSIDERLTISNMTTEWGALAGVFPVDDITIKWFRKRADFIANRGLANVPSDLDGQNGIHPRINHSRIDTFENANLKADEKAFYIQDIQFDLTTVRPHISGPNHVKSMIGISDAESQDIKINKAYLVSCVNSRADDLTAAANVVKTRKIAPGVDFYIAAASNEVQAESEKKGDWQTLIDAGATPLPPGCGPCIGLGIGLLGPGEVGISATNRNFKGRMGDPTAEAYLASPAVVAASAIAGKIAGVDNYDATSPIGNRILHTKPEKNETSTKLLDGFPEEITGELIFCHQDNLNTDGIYPGKYTYIDDFTPKQQAEVVMENYDPEFGKVVKEGDLLAGGYNFGTGSSREQAATALKYKGIQLVIAGSAGATYMRNALNNSFLVLEIPELIDDLKTEYGESKLTVTTNSKAKIDFRNSLLTFKDKEYTFTPVGFAAQELVVLKGLENWVKSNLHI